MTSMVPTAEAIVESLLDGYYSTNPATLPLAAERFFDLPADTQAGVYIEAESSISPLVWVKKLAKAGLERKMLERRAARGPDDQSPVTVPHPSLIIENKVDADKYEFDAEQIREGLRGLPDEEVEKIIRVQPERAEYVLPLTEKQAAALEVAITMLHNGDEVEVSAAPVLESLLETRMIPETVTVRNTATLLAWLKRNAGSERAKIVASGVRRNINGTVTTIKIKPHMKAVEPAIPALKGAA